MIAMRTTFRLGAEQGYLMVGGSSPRLFRYTQPFASPSWRGCGSTFAVSGRDSVIDITMCSLLLD